jgi:MFS family permease
VNSNVRLILADVFLLSIVQTMISVLIPLVASDRGLETSVIGLLVALPLAVGLVTDIPAAKASDHFGRRPALASGSVIGGIGAIILLGGHSLPILVAGSLLFGLSISWTMGPALAFVTEAANADDHARIQGYNGAIQGLGAISGAAVVGGVVAIWGPQAAFASIAATLAMVIVLAIRTHERPRVRATRSKFDPIIAVARGYYQVARMLLQEPRMRIASIIVLMYWFQVIVLGNGFVPVFLVGTKGFSSAEAGLLLALRSLVAAGLSLTFGIVVGKFGMVDTITFTSALGIAGIGLVPILVGSPFLAVAFALQGAGAAFVPATCNLLITSSTSESERALGFSAANLVARSAGLVLPIVLGVAASVGGYVTLFLVAVLLSVGMVATLVGLARGSNIYDGG